MKNPVRISTVLLLSVIICVVIALQGSLRERWDNFKVSAKKTFWAPRDKILAWRDRREEKKRGVLVLSPAEVIVRKKAGIPLTVKFRTITSPEIEATKKKIAVFKQVEKKLWEESKKVEREQGSYAANKIASKAMDMPFKIKNLERKLVLLKAQEMDKKR